MRKKIIITLIILILLIAGIAGGYFGYKYYKEKVEEERKRQEGVKIFTPSEEEIEAAKNKLSINGKIKEIKDKTIVLEATDPNLRELFLSLGAKSTENPELEITVDEDTEIRKGDSSEEGDLEDLQVGKQIQVGIDREDKEVSTIWYE